jgi:hypothetical protein
VQDANALAYAATEYWQSRGEKTLAASESCAKATRDTALFQSYVLGDIAGVLNTTQQVIDNPNYNHRANTISNVPYKRECYLQVFPPAWKCSSE